MVRSKHHPLDGQTAEQRAFSERLARRLERGKRQQCDGMAFWKLCTRPRCRRDHACTGDPHECFERNWGRMPEDIKEWWRGAILAKVNGATTAEELAQAAETRRTGYLALRKRHAASRGTAQPDPAVPPEQAPRVRSL